jgi:hypothetical protein
VEPRCRRRHGRSSRGAGTALHRALSSRGSGNLRGVGTPLLEEGGYTVADLLASVPSLASAIRSVSPPGGGQGAGRASYRDVRGPLLAAPFHGWRPGSGRHRGAGPLFALARG